MPPPATRTFKDVEEEARDLILSLNTLNVSRHSQGTRPARWRETTIPFSVVEEPSALSHLLFEVWIQDGPNSGLARGAQIGEEQQVNIAARMRTQFSYKVRPKMQIEDRRMATEAALDVLRVMMQPWDYEVRGCVIVLLVNAMSVSLTLDGGWILVQQDWIVEFDLDNSAITPI